MCAQMMDSMDARVAAFYRQLSRRVVNRDVLFSQHIQRIPPITHIQDMKTSSYGNDGAMADEEYGDPEDEFAMFLDNLCAKEVTNSIADTADVVFGCVCCQSCQQKSKQFMSKTNQTLDEFRDQLLALKRNVRQELTEINAELNQTRLKFTKLLVDLQIQLNDKNAKLDKILDMSSLLSQTNDYLLTTTSKNSVIIDKVCKENVEYRNRLGIELKVVLNREECNNYRKEAKRRKRFHTNIDSVITDVIQNHVKVEPIECVVQSELQVMAKSSPPMANSRITTTSTLAANRKTYSGPKSRSPNKVMNGFANDIKDKEAFDLSQKISKLKEFNSFGVNNHLIHNINCNISGDQLQTNYSHLFEKYFKTQNGKKVKHRDKPRSSDSSPAKSDKSQDAVPIGRHSQEVVNGRDSQGCLPINQNRGNPINNNYINSYKRFCENRDFKDHIK